MARTRTLADMRADVRERANNQRASNAVLNEAINQHIAGLYDILVQAHGAQYFKSATPQTVTTSSGTAVYALGATFYKVLAVWWQIGANDHREILPYPENAARGPQRDTGWNQYAGRIYYAVENAGIRFQPTPQAAHTVLVEYVPAAVRLSADSDTFDGYNGWELYPIYMAAADIARDESEFELSDRLEGKAAEMAARIQRMANRDHASPPRQVQRRQYDSPLFDDDWEGLI